MHIQDYIPWSERAGAFAFAFAADEDMMGGGEREFEFELMGCDWLRYL